MQIVPSFGKAVLNYAGAPTGRIASFLEPHFETDAGGTAIPDGLITVDRGKTHWACLVEVKTGRSTLDAEQVGRYLGIANREGFDALLTISNEIVADGDESPVKVDRRRLRNVTPAHVSWFRIMTEAVLQSEHHGVDDPEQAFILSDLIAYLDDERSGAAGFEGMGQEWVKVRNAARQRTLRMDDPGVREVAEGWDEFVEYLGLRLRQNLGRSVAPLYPRNSKRTSRIAEYATSLGESGLLEATIKVPDAVGPIRLNADLASQLVTTSARIGAPKEGRAKTRINWLLRQLKTAPDDLRVTASFARTRFTTSLMLPDVREKPESLLLGDDPKREPTGFDLALSRDMGIKRGKGRGSFTAQTMDQMLDFYGEVLQSLRRWTAAPPKLQEPKAPAEEPETEIVETPPAAWNTETDQH